MKIKGLTIEDFVNYKNPAMFISLGSCDYKCCIEGGFDKSVCQNSPLAHAPEFEMSIETLYEKYITNPITEAVVIGGMEPMTKFDDICELIQYFRDNGCNDEFVIYTGYYLEEIQEQVNKLSKLKNVILKVGRFRMPAKKRFDEVLGIELASENQYGIRL